MKLFYYFSVFILSVLTILTVVPKMSAMEQKYKLFDDLGTVEGDSDIVFFQEILFKVCYRGSFSAALEAYDFDMVEFCLAKEIDPNKKEIDPNEFDSKQGISPLGWCLSKIQELAVPDSIKKLKPCEFKMNSEKIIKMVALLRHYGADPNREIRINYKTTAIDYALAFLEWSMVHAPSRVALAQKILAALR